MRMTTGVFVRTACAAASGLLIFFTLAGSAIAESGFPPLPRIEEPGKRCPAVAPSELTDELVANGLGVSVERLLNVKLMRNLDIAAV